MRKLGYSLLFIIIIGVTVVLLENKVGDEATKNEGSGSVSAPENEEETPESSKDDGSNGKGLIKNIFGLSQHGKIMQAPFVAGKTEIGTVHDKWGEPKQSSVSSKGIYESFSSRYVTVAYQDNTVFDVRSYHKNLANIHLNTIKKELGEPDKVRYYKDNTHNQIILIYQVNAPFQLKWILPKPTENEPNPEVHHISVSTKLHKPQQTVTEIVEKMSLEEKIGQMVFTGISGTVLTQKTKILINKYNVGGIIFYEDNLQNPQQTVKLRNQIIAENAEKSLPLFLGVDQEGGRISRLPGGLTGIPTNKKIGAVNSSEFSYDIGSLLGKELNAFGFNLDFAPVIDVNSNPDNPIIGNRSFGNNPEVVSKLGIQTMKGLQSQHVIPVIKHFPGHGDTSVDSHLQLPKVNKSLEELNKLELIPFKNAIESGADMVMVAHILLPQIDNQYPATMSEKIISGLLRKQLDFNGVVITDDITMNAITNNYGIEQTAVQSVKAGSDIILVAHGYNKVVSVIDALKAAVTTGEISEQRINTSVSRIIELKQKYNINNKKIQAIDVNALNQIIENVLD
ncbi:beta-N-acetylhexosaminidase [Virgibacillus sp. DJP39]|uniref:beta-N-acetylhexosaminidase n=1 Tax=Virgibacillus sp. DJP39 TaxID=3409790 RepID=UPI003BB69D5E